MVWHYALTPLSRHSFATSSWAVAPCAASSVLPSTGLQLHSAAAKLLQSCPTLCDLIDGSPPGSPVSGILQARTLEWVAISLSSAWKWKVNVKSLSHVRLLATHGLQPARLFRPWDFPGKSNGVGCHCLLPEPLEKPKVIVKARNLIGCRLAKSWAGWSSCWNNFWICDFSSCQERITYTE